jgi:ABC-type antimicrobial peptide transport system permease subunit
VRPRPATPRAGEWATIAVIVVIAAVAGAVAAVPPSRRAARLDVLRAIVSD